MIKLGAWSTALLLLALQALVLAVAIVRAPGNARANRTLAALLVVIAGLMTPFILGYAGAYDACPWLSFAPFAVPLAVGPLLYAHVVALAEGRGIARWHWLAPLFQFGWQAALFPLPTATKDRIDASLVDPFLGPVNDAAVLMSMIAYGFAAWLVLKRYRLWLGEQRRVDRPARRIWRMILVLVPLVAARAAYSLFGLAVRPVTYFDLFGYYLLLGGSALWLGLSGWKAAAEPAPAARDEDAHWADRGGAWLAELERAGWWRDPDLGLDALARRLGTNSAHLSRGLAAHGGFARSVARIRSQAVADAINRGEGQDLLATALDHGFGSKASFNRAFRTHMGVSPSEYRDGASERTGPKLAD